MSEEVPPPDFGPAADPAALDRLTRGLQRVSAAGAEGAVLPTAVPSAGTARALLPTEGVGPDAIIAELEALARGATRVGRPGWMAHMDPPATWSSVLGAAAAALVNNNMLMAELSPSFTRLEREVVAGLAAELGLGDRAAGTFTAGGSLANLLALAVARDDRLTGLTGADGAGALGRLTVLASAEAHASVARAARVLGLDPERGVLPVAVGEDGRMDAGAASEAMDRAEAAGRRCSVLVATAGTTVLGAIDPLGPLGEMARERGLWYHVDAAYGGALALSPGHRGLVAGIGAADSVTINPQKWLYVAKTCALALFRDGRRWAAALGGGDLPYAAPEARGGAGPRIEGTRHADVVKLRLALLELGRRGVEARIERSLALAAKLAAGIAERPFLELAAQPDTNIVVFRCVGVDTQTRERRTVALRRRLLERADICLSLPTHREERWLRAVPLNPATGEETLDRLLTEIDRFGAR